MHMQISTRTLYKAQSLCHRRCNSNRRHSFTKSTHGEMPPWPRCQNPSPHDILNVNRGEPYSKENFQQLVKVYHPDAFSPDSPVGQMPQATRLQRYRLIIEANRLLSNPHLRMIYETYNVGWLVDEPLDPHNGSPTPSDVRGATARNTEWDYHGSPNRPPYPKDFQQVPIYTHNSSFAMLLLAVAMAGAIIQYKRAEAERRDYQISAIILHDKILSQLRDAADILEGKPQDERILEFLARRGLQESKLYEDIYGTDIDQNMCKR